MSGILSQKPLTFREASKVLPGRPHINTLKRWCDNGVNGVRLQSFRLGRRRFTTVEALEQFLQDTADNQQPINSLAHNAAEAQLDAMGI